MEVLWDSDADAALTDAVAAAEQRSKELAAAFDDE
jgi:pyrroline-5-carboxylate reductase